MTDKEAALKRVNRQIAMLTDDIERYSNHSNGELRNACITYRNELKFYQALHDALTSPATCEDKKTPETLINDLLQKNFTSPATPCQSCDNTCIHEKACEAVTEVLKEKIAQWQNERGNLERRIKERNTALTKYQMALDKEIKLCEGLVKALEECMSLDVRTEHTVQGGEIVEVDVVTDVYRICEKALAEYRKNGEGK